MSDITQYLMLFVIAGAVFAAAVFFAGTGLWLLHIGRENNSRFFAPLLMLIAVIGTATVAFSGRVLQFDLGTAVPEANLMDVEGKLPVKVILGLLAGLAFVTLVGRLFQSRQRMNFPFALAASFICFYVTSNSMPAAFGHYPLFQPSLIYTPLIVMALFVSMPANPQSTLRVVKASLLMIVVPSLIAGVIAPTLALQTSEKALIPGYGMRLWGLTSHANVLGAFALSLCLIEWASPYRRVAWHRLSLLSGVVALLWSQSKTSIVAALVAIGVIVIYMSLQAAKEMRLRTKSQSSLPTWIPMASLSTGMAMAVLLLLAVVFGEDIGLLSAIARRLANFDLSTIQGRTLIWQQAVNEGLKYPFFGYGLTLWSAEYRLATGLTSAFHAHNQFLQIYSTAGLFGLLGLTVYLLVLGKMSIAAARDSHGVTLALFVVFLMRSFSEVPIQLGFSGEFLAHMAFILLVGTLCRQTEQLPRATAAASPVREMPKLGKESNAPQ